MGITSKTTKEESQTLFNKVDELVKTLSEEGVRTESDLRDNVSPGWKFNHWELKGVPVRMEIGPKDLEKEQVTVVIRYSREKRFLPLNGLSQQILFLLEEIHHGMYRK